MKIPEGMTQPELYDIMCGMRGPDFGEGGDLKWLFTARIRFFACRVFGWEESILPARPKAGMYREEIERAAEEAGRIADTFALVHYLEHCQMALSALLWYVPEEFMKEVATLQGLLATSPTHWVDRMQEFLIVNEKGSEEESPPED
jgi:hypothetical protein